MSDMEVMRILDDVAEKIAATGRSREWLAYLEKAVKRSAAAINAHEQMIVSLGGGRSEHYWTKVKPW